MGLVNFALGPKIKQIRLSLRSAGNRPRVAENSRVRSSPSWGSKKAARVSNGVSAQQVLKGREGDIGVLLVTEKVENTENLFAGKG